MEVPLPGYWSFRSQDHSFPGAKVLNLPVEQEAQLLLIPRAMLRVNESLSVFHCNYVSILNRFSDIQRVYRASAH